MKRKNKKKYYRACLVTLIIMFINIDQMFHPIKLLKHVLVTNQDDTPSVDFYTARIQGMNTLEDAMRITVTFLFY